MLVLHNLIFENNIPKLMYRAGPTQNIKIFNPKKLETTHDSKFKNQSIIYTTDDISYAAGFCFNWSDKDGFEYGQINNGRWILKIPESYKHKLDDKCSMYVLDGSDCKRLNTNTPEYYSTKSLKVVKEIKFNSCYECLNKYNVNIRIFKLC